MSRLGSVDDVVKVRIHGQRRAYVKRGSGPALVLLHGLGSNLDTWDLVIDRLAERYTVVVPDMLGHGQSDKPRTDYSIGGYANGLRDLLALLGISKATVVGHSFGGGVAMQFVYQFPEHCERLVLVASGGLGSEVTPILKALSLPGAGRVLAVLASSPVRGVLGSAGRAALRLPLIGDGRLVPELRDGFEFLDGLDALSTEEARSAFLHVLRAVIDHDGQVITMADRGYLAEGIPVLIVWGDQDGVIPVGHAYRGADLLRGSRLVVFPGAGHFPHRDEAAAFVQVLDEFIEQNPPSTYSLAQFRSLLRRGSSIPA